MQLEITRSGGLSGFDREQVATIDTSELAGAAARAIETYVSELERETSPVGADMVRYDIYVRDSQERVHEFTVMDDGTPGSTLQRLLELLNVAA